MPKAKAAALKAIESDAVLAESHLALGLVSFITITIWPERKESYKRAIKLNPRLVFGPSQIRART